MAKRRGKRKVRHTRHLGQRTKMRQGYAHCHRLLGVQLVGKANVKDGVLAKARKDCGASTWRQGMKHWLS